MDAKWTGAHIRALREREGLDQAAFALCLGYRAQARVSEIETDRRTPGDSVLLLLDYIEAYGVLPAHRPTPGGG